LDIKTDNRGCLAEFLKSPSFGQIFVSRTKPGITRGNHYHHTKTEKFLVVEGEAIVRFRKIGEEISGHRSVGRTQRSEIGGQKSEVIEYRISGTEFRVVDIPPGYTHSIENVGNSDLVTLFWANQVFDPEQPDTYFEEV
jgi:UDP-2-acetamido-2,6-beta-L-arabino-hexul-4-ose reductase